MEKKTPRFTGSHHQQQEKSSKKMELSKTAKVESKLLYPAFVLYTIPRQINAVEWLHRSSSSCCLLITRAVHIAWWIELPSPGPVELDLQRSPLASESWSLRGSPLASESWSAGSPLASESWYAGSPLASESWSLRGSPLANELVCRVSIGQWVLVSSGVSIGQ